MIPAAPAPTGSSPRQSLLMPLASPTLWKKLVPFLVPSLVVIGLLLQFQIHLWDWLGASGKHHQIASAFEEVKYRRAVAVDLFERYRDQFSPADMDSLKSLGAREVLLGEQTRISEAETAEYLRSAAFDIGILLTLLLLASIYRICGKDKPAWTMLTTGVVCLLLLKTLWEYLWGPLFYWWVPQTWGDSPVTVLRLAYYVLCTGPAEESFKLIPVLLILFFGRRVALQFRARVGVWEPLDGILLAAASGACFALFETHAQYFHNMLAKFLQYPEIGFDNACLMAFGIGIYRFFFTSLLHTTLTALNGYALGLAVLMPRHRWKLIGGIFALTAILHGLYDANPFPQFVAVGDYGHQQALFPYAVSLFSLVLMLAAILKARQLSPTRSQNFATMLAGSAALTPVSGPPPLPRGGPSATPPDVRSLRVGSRTLELTGGRAVSSSDLPGVPAQPGSSIVGEVMTRKGPPEVVGLMNRSAVAWFAISVDGTRREIRPLSVVPLTAGLKLQMGPILVEIA